MLDSLDALDKARERKFSTRSEAARYAAQIRWGNRSGSATASKPAGGETATAGGDPLAERCRLAEQRHRDAGFTVEVIRGDQMTGTMQGEIEDAWNATMEPIVRSKKDDSAGRRDNMGLKAINGVDGTKYDSLVVVRHSSGAMAGVALVKDISSTRMKIEYAASSGVIPGTGSAIFAQVARMAVAKGVSELALESLPTAESFWSSMGFLAYDRSSAVTKMVRGRLPELVKELG